MNVRTTLSASSWRLWALPAVTLALVCLDQLTGVISSSFFTAVLAALILLVGIPHGTLDVEIAALRLGRQSGTDKVKIIAMYIACAAMMGLMWMVWPSLALLAFLVLSIVHFAEDWRSSGEYFFAMMIGWALISLPALSHPAAVATLFELLTDDGSGSLIAALLAASSVPAIGGSLIFVAQSFQQGKLVDGTNVISCLIAAVLLPPLAGFAVFFCGLHSPRHLREAIHQSGMLPGSSKMIRALAVLALSLAIAATLFHFQDAVRFDSGVIRTTFVMLSVLTVPHFLLEWLGSIVRKPAPYKPDISSSHL